jgi:hypothetical protein
MGLRNCNWIFKQRNGEWVVRDRIAGGSPDLVLAFMLTKLVDGKRKPRMLVKPVWAAVKATGSIASVFCHHCHW